MSECKHEFVYLSTDSYKKTTGRYSWKFVQVKSYFCKWCLEEREMKKEHSCGDYELDKIPDWAKLITTKVSGYE